MATTETVACKFIAKETENGTPYLAIEYLGRKPLMFEGNFLSLHFLREQTIEEAQAMANYMNQKFERISVMHFTSLDGIRPNK